VSLKFFKQPKSLAIVAVKHYVVLQHQLQDFVAAPHFMDLVANGACKVLLNLVVLTQILLLCS
jgi:hypothetical protein